MTDTYKVKREEATQLFLDYNTAEEPQKTQLRDQLIELHMPLARYLARRYKNRGIAEEDLQQVAYIGLIKAVERYDPTQGWEFSTYATPTISGEVKRHFRDKGWMIRVPRRVQEAKLEVTKAIAVWRQHYGAEPTISELATFTSMPEADVVEALMAGDLYATQSLDVPMREYNGDTDERHQDPGYLPADYETVELRESLKKHMSDIPLRDQKILYARFWEHKTQAVIAEELGISQMHVSRRLAATLLKLRDSIEGTQ